MSAHNQHSELLVHPKTGRRLGTDERPCETCGKPHVERMKSPDGGYTTWADPDDGHVYKPPAWRPYLQRRVRDLEEQVQSLEIACDHHKMFWQKAEERERGLKEQHASLERKWQVEFDKAHELEDQYEGCERECAALQAEKARLLEQLEVLRERVTVEPIVLREALRLLEAGQVKTAMATLREFMESNPAKERS